MGAVWNPVILVNLGVMLIIQSCLILIERVEVLKKYLSDLPIHSHGRAS